METTPQLLFSSRLARELVFSVSRSGGPGGQHVNKVSSKVTLKLDIRNSHVLTDEEKEVLLQKLASKLTESGVLILVVQESRSQIENKQAVLHKLNDLLSKAFKKRKPRKATKPTKGSVLQRAREKKLHSEKKKWRKNID